VLWQVTHRGAGAAGTGRRAIPGEPNRIAVEVLNATTRTGLARDVTERLRDGGLDVVYYGSDTSRLDSTQILVRRGGMEAGDAVRRVLGAGAVRAAVDPSRLVDVSVLVGRDAAALLGDP